MVSSLREETLLSILIDLSVKSNVSLLKFQDEFLSFGVFLKMFFILKCKHRLTPYHTAGFYCVNYLSQIFIYNAT